MRFGYFDDKAKEYVIERPDTPRSWANYLGSTEYGAIITNNAGGYSFYQSAAQGRLTRLRFDDVPLDQPGRYIYLRDRQSGGDSLRVRGIPAVCHPAPGRISAACQYPVAYVSRRGASHRPRKNLPIKLIAEIGREAPVGSRFE